MIQIRLEFTQRSLLLDVHQTKQVEEGANFVPSFVLVECFLPFTVCFRLNHEGDQFKARVKRKLALIMLVRQFPSAWSKRAI